MTAVGVARPRAHGQAMIMHGHEIEQGEGQAGGGPEAYQTTNVTTAIAMTAGTK